MGGRRGGRFPWLVPGGSFHPDDEDLSQLVRRAFVGLGLRVVKLHCSVGDFSPADPRLEPLWAAAAAEGVPVLVHAGRRSPGDAAANEIEALGPVLDAHPRLNIVLAHTGHPAVEAAIALMSRHDNLYADVTPVWLNEISVTPAAIEAYAGRFLFGSDAPNNPTPVADQVARFASMGLSGHALTMLMGGAAANLIPTAEQHRPARS